MIVESDVFPFAGSSYLGPAPQYARLRAERPVARVRTAGGVDAWLVTRYEDVRMALADQRLSRAETVKPDAPRIGGSMHSTPEIIISLDNPEHSRMRRLVAGAFTARRIGQLRPMIQRIADGLLDEIAAKGGPLDLVEAFTLRMPLMVIGEMLGVPLAVLEQFVQNAREFISLDEGGGGELAEHGMFMLFQRMVEIVAEKRANPTDDLLSVLIAARDQEDRLTESELVTFCFTLVGAGFDTTQCQLASTVLALISRYPDQWKWLNEDPSRVPTAVEELLRFVNLYATDTAGNPRIALEDMEIGGQQIRAGDAVVIAIASANRDDRVFPDPDRLDLTRSPNPHVTFGHGMHLCIGKQLTRMEIEVAIDGLVRRFPDLRLAVPEEDLKWNLGEINHSVVSLPVTW